MADNRTPLRDAVPSDAEELTSLFLRSRAQAMPWLVSPHDDASVRWWMEHVLNATQGVRVADDGSHIQGFAAVEGDCLEHLYIGPDDQGRGVGRALLEEANGFVLVEQSDGRRNEEQEPDCTYGWTP